MPDTIEHRTAGDLTWAPLRRSGQSSRDLTYAYAVLTFEFKKLRKSWAGKCVELGTATNGSSLDEARESLTQLVMLHLNALEKTKQRERIFDEAGIELYRGVEPQVPPTNNQAGKIHQLFGAQLSPAA